MGTRADFYIGHGKDAEWLGSVAWDGYEWSEPDNDLANATTPEAFRAAVAEIAKHRDDFTDPSQGWPWPWKDSRTTDWAYMLIDGAVRAYCFGESIIDDSPGDFPDMSAVQNVDFGARSGIIIVGG